MNNYFRYLNKKNVVLMSFTSVNVTPKCRQTKGFSTFAKLILKPNFITVSETYTVYARAFHTKVQVKSYRYVLMK